MLQGSRGGGAAVTYLGVGLDDGRDRCRNSSNLGFTSSSLGNDNFRYTSGGAASSPISPPGGPIFCVNSRAIRRSRRYGAFAFAFAFAFACGWRCDMSHDARQDLLWPCTPNAAAKPRSLFTWSAIGRRAASDRGCVKTPLALTTTANSPEPHQLGRSSLRFFDARLPDGRLSGADTYELRHWSHEGLSPPLTASLSSFAGSLGCA